MYGRAYFLSTSALIMTLCAPEYFISANFNMAAAECGCGTLALESTDVTMRALVVDADQVDEAVGIWADAVSAVC